MHLSLFSHEPHEGRPGERTKTRWGRTLAMLVSIGLAALLASQCVFFVDETQYVYVTQFGRPLRLHCEPGLAVKWPYQGLRRFDRRLQIYEPPPREILTQDKENLNFEWFVCWRLPGVTFVSDEAQRRGDESSTQSVPVEIERYVDRFMKSLGTPAAAERRLEERIQAALAAEIGRTRLDQLVSLDAEQLALSEISRNVTDRIREMAAEQFGIEVVDVRLKRFSYPDAVKPAVYAEIRSERERVAVQYRAEGASEKAKIESLADLRRDQLLAQAEREATAVRGEGEAKAIEIFNAAHRQNAEFYRLLKTLDTYRSILDDQTTVVLSADSPLLKLLMEGVPPLETREQPASGGSSLPARPVTPSEPSG